MLPVSSGEVCRPLAAKSWGEALHWLSCTRLCAYPNDLLEPLVGATPTSENKSAIELQQLPFPPWATPDTWTGFTLIEPRSRYYICSGISMGRTCLECGPPWETGTECRCTCPECGCCGPNLELGGVRTPRTVKV